MTPNPGFNSHVAPLPCCVGRELRAAAVHAHKRAKVACSASQQASPNTPGPQGGSAGAAPAPAPVAGAVSALPPNRPAGTAAAAALQPAPVQQQPAGTQVQPNQPVAAAAAAPQAAPAQQQPAGAQAQPNQLVFPVAVMPGRHEMLEQLADILPPIHVWDRPPRLLDMYRQAEQQLDAVWRRPAGMLAAAAPPLFALPQAPAYLPLVPPPPPPLLNRIDYRAPMPRPLHADQDPLLQMARGERAGAAALLLLCWWVGGRAPEGARTSCSHACRLRRSHSKWVCLHPGDMPPA